MNTPQQVTTTTNTHAAFPITINDVCGVVVSCMSLVCMQPASFRTGRRNVAVYLT